MTKQERLEYMKNRFPVLKKLASAGESISESDIIPKVEVDPSFALALPTYQRYIEETMAERNILTSDEL